MKTFASILFLASGISTVFACMCFNIENITDAQHSKYLKQVKAVFYGEVISLNEKRIVEIKYPGNVNSSTTYQPVKFKVLQTWKGIETVEVFVETDVGSSCSYAASVGSKIMVYAYENKATEIPFYVNYCSVGHFDDEKMKREYGAGKVFEQPQVEQTQAAENAKGFWAKLLETITSFFS